MFKLLVALLFLKVCFALPLPPLGGIVSLLGPSLPVAPARPVAPPQPIATSLPVAPAPSGGKTPVVVPIISEENDLDPDGSYHYSFESGDGTIVHQEGQLKTFEGGKEGEVVQGSYSYTDNEGQTFTITYTADETGFHATGDHLPQIPEAIVKSLKYIEEHPTVVAAVL